MFIEIRFIIWQIIEKETGMTSLRIKAEKEKELSEAEAYWRKRFVKQEQEVKKIPIEFFFEF